MILQSEVTGNGSPIVLVPGGLTGWASWEPFVNEFSDNRTVIRVQLLGVQFGLEDRALPEGYSIKTESSALAVTLDSLGYKMPDFFSPVNPQESCPNGIIGYILSVHCELILSW